MSFRKPGYLSLFLQTYLHVSNQNTEMHLSLLRRIQTVLSHMHAVAGFSQRRSQRVSGEDITFRPIPVWTSAVAPS